MGLQGKGCVVPGWLAPQGSGGSCAARLDGRAVPLRARPASAELTYRQEWMVALCARGGQAWSFGEVLGVFR